MKPAPVATRPVRNAAELNAIRPVLELTDDELAEELGIAPAVIRAWSAGTTKIPTRAAEYLEWRAALAERRTAMRASGLPECARMKVYGELPMPDDVDGQLVHFEAINAHAASCDTCQALQRYENEHFGPMPDEPVHGWARVFRLVEHVPSRARPAVVGAAILAAIVSMRVVFAIPTLLETPSRIGALLFAIVAAAGAGAAGGLAYSFTRPTLRKLGLPGAYLTGIVCVGAYMGALVIVGPVAFGEPLVEDRGELVIFGIVTLFFGLVMGHSWFRDPKVM